uniref:Integrin, alpha 5 (fibronectin receptor, alpha polypeptide) n=1 Tax=Oncorhynchus kisutch TaxID=8019 RepID=A0A8C7GT71_ONCKI
MGSKRYHSKTPGKLNYSLFCIGVCLIILLPLCDTFNLDVENPSVYSGPNGSYFGYSVEFYLTNSSRVNSGS